MNFGVLGTAGIARGSFIPGVAASEYEVTAIASRSQERANAVAAEFDIPAAYGEYEHLLADAEIDAVYIPLPNGLHGEWTRRAADAGLDVLCEKPLTADAETARDVVAHCAEQDVTLMEAFMYRYHPRTERVLELASEELGELRSVSASFTFSLADRPDDIRLSPELAGGSLLDVGCYPVSIVRQLLGEPDRVYGRRTDRRDAGVDTTFTGVLEYDSGATAQIASGFETPKHQRYRVEAEDGWLVVEDAFDAPVEPLSIEYQIDGRHAVETFDPVDQYRLEAEAFATAVETGTTPRTDGQEAIENMCVLDALAESARRAEPVQLSD